MNAIVACARGWIGTRFHHQGRLKKSAQHKGGVDCLGLLVGVADELGLKDAGGENLSAADETNYAHYPDTHRLRQKLSEILKPIAIPEIRPGDIVLLRVDDYPQHLAIVSDNPQGLGIIHAYAPARRVVEHGFDDYWISRIEAAFRIPSI